MSEPKTLLKPSKIKPVFYLGNISDTLFNQKSQSTRKQGFQEGTDKQTERHWFYGFNIYFKILLCTNVPHNSCICVEESH